MRRLLSQQSSVENLLMELNNVRKIVCREMSFFSNPLIEEEKKRKRLNFLFVKDLLDGVNGMIMDHKDRRDNEMVTHQVEGWHKVLASSVVFFTSFGMMYYVYLFSMRQSASRQRAWFSSFQVWLFFEVCVISTGLVFVEHVLIPLWSLREVQRVKKRIVSDLLTFQKNMKQASSSNNKKKIGPKDDILESEATSFNAAEFLFPSYRLAVLFPHYPESVLIQRYKTPWPKKSLKQNEKSMRKRYDKRFEFFTKTVARVVVFTLATIIQLPPSLQDLGIQVTLLALCGWIVRFHLLLYGLYPVFVALPLVLVSTVIYVLFVSGRTARSNIYPLASSSEENPNEEHHGNENNKADPVRENLRHENQDNNLRERDGEEAGEGKRELPSSLIVDHTDVLAVESRESFALQGLSLGQKILERDSSSGEQVDDDRRIEYLFDSSSLSEEGDDDDDDESVSDDCVISIHVIPKSDASAE